MSRHFFVLVFTFFIFYVTIAKETDKSTVFSYFVAKAAPILYPWHSWIARQTPTLKVAGSNPVG